MSIHDSVAGSSNQDKRTGAKVCWQKGCTVDIAAIVGGGVTTSQNFLYGTSGSDCCALNIDETTGASEAEQSANLTCGLKTVLATSKIPVKGGGNISPQKAIKNTKEVPQ